MQDDFEQHGAATFAKLREDDPASYLRIVGSFVPREGATREDFSDLSDEEIVERIGVDLFLAKLPKGRLKARFERNVRKCASQLSTHTHVYFPDYPKLLRLAYLHLLANTTDLDAIRRSGVLMLASASLPGVRTDIRRKLRRRGATWDRTIVQDATIEQRIGLPRDPMHILAAAPS